MFKDRSDATGRAVLVGDHLIIETEEGVKAFPRAELHGIVEGAVKEQYLKYLAPDASVTNPQHDAFVPFQTFGDVDLAPDITWYFSWLTNLVVTTIGNTNHTGETGFNIEITSVLDFDISFLYLRTENPPPRDDGMGGTVPVKKNDYQLVFSIGVDLG